MLERELREIIGHIKAGYRIFADYPRRREDIPLETLLGEEIPQEPGFFVYEPGSIVVDGKVNDQYVIDYPEIEGQGVPRQAEGFQTLQGLQWESMGSNQGNSFLKKKSDPKFMTLDQLRAIRSEE